MDKTFPYLSLVWMVQIFFHNSDNLVKLLLIFSIQTGAEFVFFFFSLFLNRVGGVPISSLLWGLLFNRTK